MLIFMEKCFKINQKLYGGDRKSKYEKQNKTKQNKTKQNKTPLKIDSCFIFYTYFNSNFPYLNIGLVACFVGVNLKITCSYNLMPKSAFSFNLIPKSLRNYMEVIENQTM